VTFEDVQSLSHWLDQFQKEAPTAQTVFVFAVRFANIDIETDGCDVYDDSGERFRFLAIPLQKDADTIKIRSPKWQTVVLPAEDFRRYAELVSDIITPEKV
jgi:hypothetical protein